MIVEDVLLVRGSVKWFDPVKGFGFVVADTGGPDILLHANVLRNFGQNSIADGARIELSAQITERGVQAIRHWLTLRILTLRSSRRPLSKPHVSNGLIKARVLALQMSTARTMMCLYISKCSAAQALLTFSQAKRLRSK